MWHTQSSKDTQQSNIQAERPDIGGGEARRKGHTFEPDSCPSRDVLQFSKTKNNDVSHSVGRLMLKVATNRPPQRTKKGCLALAFLGCWLPLLYSPSRLCEKFSPFCVRPTFREWERVRFPSCGVELLATSPPVITAVPKIAHRQKMVRTLLVL